MRDIDRSGVKTQVVALDGGGAAGESLVSATNPLPISVNAANFIISAGNSTTTQLAPGGVFSGAIETALNQPSVSILVTTDQPGVLTVYQYTDAAGLFQAPTPMRYSIPAGTNGYGFSVTVEGNYYRIGFVNNGAGTTTTLNVNTAVGTIPATTNLGNGPVSINEIGGTAVAGTLPISGTVNVSNFPGGNVDALDPNFAATTRLVGRPDGDFANVDLIEALMDDGSGLSANVVYGKPGQQTSSQSVPVVLSTELTDITPIRLTAFGAQANSTVLGAIVNCAKLRSISVQVVSMGLGANITPQWSNDGSNWFTISLLGNGTGAASGAQIVALTAGLAIHTSTVYGQYFRLLQSTGQTSGTTLVNIAGFQSQIGPQIVANYGSTLSGAVSIAGTASQNIAQIGATATLSTLAAATGSATMPVSSPTPQNLTNDAIPGVQTVSGNAVSGYPGIGGVFGGVVSITASSGTGQTLDLVVQESVDTGTTYTDVYHCERLTGVGALVIPPLPIFGIRRYAWTIGGTTPSFTFAVLKTMAGGPVVYPLFRQFFDRTAGLLAGTASATSSTYTVAGCKTITAAITIGAATTGGVYKLQGSSDGANWYDISATVTAVASSTVQITNTAGVVARFVRVFVSTGATAQTGTVVSITGTN